MRQTILEMKTNVAYRWFLGYGFSEKIPHFSTCGKNYVRRFKDTEYRILREAMEKGFVDPPVAFIAYTHVKASGIKRNLIKKLFALKQETSKTNLMQKLILIEKKTEKSHSPTR
jgi:transposase